MADEVVPEWVAEMSELVVAVAASPETEEVATVVEVVDTVAVVDSVVVGDLEVTAAASTLEVLPSHPLLPVVPLGGRRCLPLDNTSQHDTPIPRLSHIRPPDILSRPDSSRFDCQLPKIPTPTRYLIVI